MILIEAQQNDLLEKALEQLLTYWKSDFSMQHPDMRASYFLNESLLQNLTLDIGLGSMGQIEICKAFAEYLTGKYEIHTKNSIYIILELDEIGRKIQKAKGDFEKIGILTMINFDDYMNFRYLTCPLVEDTGLVTTEIKEIIPL